MASALAGGDFIDDADVLRTGGTAGAIGCVNSISSCAIITTAANDLLAPIHDRMPVILPRELEELWLDRSVDDSGELGSVLTPYADERMEAYEVSTLVNSAANDGPEVIARIA